MWSRLALRGCGFFKVFPIRLPQRPHFHRSRSKISREAKTSEPMPALAKLRRRLYSFAALRRHGSHRFRRLSPCPCPLVAVMTALQSMQTLERPRRLALHGSQKLGLAPGPCKYVTNSPQCRQGVVRVCPVRFSFAFCRRDAARLLSRAATAEQGGQYVGLNPASRARGNSARHVRQVKISGGASRLRSARSALLRRFGGCCSQQGSHRFVRRLPRNST